MNRFEEENQDIIKNYVIMPISSFNKYLNGKARILTRLEDRDRWWRELKKNPKLLQKSQIKLKDYSDLVHYKISVVYYEQKNIFEIAKEQIGINIIGCRWVNDGNDIEIVYENILAQETE